MSFKQTEDLMEEWKQFRDLPYLVSNRGLVKTIPHIVIRSNGRKHSIKERVLSPAIDTQGYYRFAINVNGKLATFKLHRVVCEVFNGISTLEVNHLDGNKTNNISSNLEWCTRSENLKHAFKTGLCKPQKGESNPTAIISEKTAIDILLKLRQGLGPSKISRDLGVSINITKDISRGKTWKHLH